MTRITTDFRKKDMNNEDKSNYLKNAISDTLKSPTNTYPIETVKLTNSFHLSMMKDKNNVSIIESQGKLVVASPTIVEGSKDNDFEFTGTVISEDGDIIRDFLRLGMEFPKEDLLLYFPSIEKVVKCWELPLPETVSFNLHHVLVHLADKNDHIHQSQLFRKALMVKGSFVNTNGK